MTRKKCLACLGLFAALAAAGLHAAAAEGAEFNATATYTVTQLTPNATECRPDVTFTIAVDLSGLEGTNSTELVLTPVPAGCVMTVPEGATNVTLDADNDNATATFECTYPAPHPNDTLTFALSGVAGADVYNFDPATFTAEFTQTPNVTITLVEQAPTALAAHTPSAGVNFTFTVAFTGVSDANETTRIEEPAGCALVGSAEGLGAGDYDTVLEYLCQYANASMVPANVTFVGRTSLEGCHDDAVWTKTVNYAVVMTPAAAFVQQECYAAGAALVDYLVHYSLISGASDNVTAADNCTLTAGGFDGAGVGTNIFYTCSVPFSNTTTAKTFTAHGDSTVSSSVTLPASVVAARPIIDVTSVAQTIATPLTGARTTNAASVTYTIAAAITGLTSADDLGLPSQCAILTNTTGFEFPWSGALSLNCTYPVADITTNANTSMSRVMEEHATFALTTDAAACNATAKRNLTAVFEPAVSASILDMKQGCAAADGAVSFNVSVAYTGAKDKVIVAPSTCLQTSVAALDATGSGTVMYACAFASANASANATLNFTAVGLIEGEVHSAISSLPDAVVAVKPSVEITSAPVQGVTLMYGDTTTPVNFTLTAKFTGATRGYSINGVTANPATGAAAGCTTDGNATAVADGGAVTLNFTCAFSGYAAVPNKITFRALTTAEECFTEAEDAYPKAQEDRVYAAPSTPAQLCLAALTAPVTYEVGVYYSGARANRTFPEECTEDEADLNEKGTGPAAYTCEFANSSLVAPLSFNADGILPGDVDLGTAASATPPPAVLAGKPTLALSAPVQDILKAGDNTSAAIFNINVEVAGADRLAVGAENGTCTTTSKDLTKVTGNAFMWSLNKNVTVRAAFKCNFTNSSNVDDVVGFAAWLSTAGGCNEMKNATIEVELAAADSIVPYTYSMRFAGMDYDEITKAENAAQLDAFKMSVRGAVALAVGLPLGNVEIANITKGSVVAAVVLQTPATWTPEMVTAAAATLTTNAGSVFNAAFLEEWGIESVEVTLEDELPAVKKTMPTMTQIGIGVGVGVGGLVLGGGAVAYAMSRKRRAAVEPRDRMV